MPPPVALLLCTGFVLFILRYDRRQPVKLSKISWLPTIWMFSISTKPLATWFGSGGTDAESGSPLDRMFQLALLLFGLFILSQRRVSWSKALRTNSWFILLLGYMLLSILWSDIPFVSFKRWIREFSALVMAMVMLTERSPRDAMIAIFRRTTYILIPFSMLLIKYYPYYGRQYGRWSGGEMWVGVALQKNALGRLCMISAFFLIWTLVRRWKKRERAVDKHQTYAEVFVLLLTLYLFKGADNAYSATSLAALIIGLAAYFGMWWLEKQRIPIANSLLTGVLTFGIIIGVSTPLLGGGPVGKYAGLLGRDATLTSRTDIWAGVLPYFYDKPFIGTGFGGFWTTAMQSVQLVNEAHNGYLDVLLQLGVVGMFLTAMFILSCGWEARKFLFKDYDWGNLCICFALMTIIHSIGETAIDSFTNQLTATQLFLLFTCARAPLTPTRQAAPVSKPPTPSDAVHFATSRI